MCRHKCIDSHNCFHRSVLHEDGFGDMDVILFGQSFAVAIAVGDDEGDVVIASRAIGDVGGVLGCGSGRCGAFESPLP